MENLYNICVAALAHLVEQLTCNQQVVGSSPTSGTTQKNVVRFPSGQREQTVNLPAQPSKVRILPSPPFFILRRKNKYDNIVSL